MDDTFFHAFPNHFKGAGQPAFVGKSQDEKQKVAVWWKKDRKGRPFLAIKTEDVEVPGEAAEKDIPGVGQEVSSNDGKQEAPDEPEFLF